MPAIFSRVLQSLALLLSLAMLLPAPRGDAQASLPTRHPVDVAHYYFKHVGIHDGIQPSSIARIYQDDQGFLWITAMPAGLYRYDGQRVIPFPEVEGPRGHVMVATGDVTGAGHGRLWISVLTAPGQEVGSGLRLVDSTGRLLPLPAGIRAPGGGASLLRVAGNDLLMAGPEGISLWQAEPARLRVLWRAPADADGTHALVACGSGIAYALSAGSLWRVDLRAPSAAALALPGATALSTGQALLCTHAGHLLVGTNRGLFELGPAGWTKRWPASSVAGVNALAEDASGAVWIAPESGGLIRLDRAGQAETLPARHGTPGGLPPGVVRQLLVTRNNTLWALIGWDGLLYTDPMGTRFQSVSVPDSRDPADNANYVRALAPAGGGKVWVGSHAGLMRYDPRTRLLSNYTPLLLPTLAGAQVRPAGLSMPAPGQVAVEGIVRDPGTGVLWLATNAGRLLRFDPATGRARFAYRADPDNPAPGQWLFTVWRARDGTFWIAGATRGAARWRPGMNAPQWLPAPPGERRFPHIFGFAAGAHGGVWMPGNGGLIHWRHGQLQLIQHQPDHPESLASDSAISVASTADGSLWVGTVEGVDRLARNAAGPPRFVHYGVHQGLPDNIIYCMVEQPRGMLWIGTNLGVSALDIATGRIVRYGERAGIRGLESNAGTCTRLDNGAIAFGGPEGFVIGAATREQPPVPTTVHLSSVRLGNGNPRPAPLDGLLDAMQGETVRISFSGLDFLHPNATLYRYRLRGLDKAWSKVSAYDEVLYRGLASGHYVFEVASSWPDGRLASPPARLAVFIVPPWWDSPALRAIYALLAGGVVLLLAGMAWGRRRSERTYRRESAAREERLKLALWGSGDALWELDLQRGLLHRMGGENLLGGPREDVMTLDDWRRYAVHPDDLPALETALGEHLSGNTPYYESEHRIRAGDGQWIWVRARGKVSQTDATGRPLRVIGTSRNISAELTREREHSIADLVLRSMGEAVAVHDVRMRFVAVNPAFTRMTGYAEHEIIGESAALLDSQDQPEASQHVRAQLDATGHFRGELWQRKRDGDPVLCRIEINEIRDSHGDRTHFVAVLSDVTARRRAEQELHYLANYDPLTGLPNRTLLSERLGDAILRARQTGRLVATLFVDLDRFKHVNDAHGHSVGDRVLQAAARRLRAAIRDDDTVARLGGDEFTIVLERVARTADAEDVARKILQIFSETMDLGEGREVQITPSIGIAIYPNHGQVPTDLLKYADIAMYRAKERGRNTYSVYTEALDAEVRQRADLIAALQRALKREELNLVYQPKLSLAEDRITGVEALLRWQSDEFGEIPPSLFIPLAEEIGLIGALGEFAIERACGELAGWRESGLDNVTMAVNVSVAQLGRGDFSSYLFETLERYRLPPQLLELELTESMLMQDPERSRAILETINSVGVTLAIDDFGTGYSSLAYLQRLPLDTLKIDQTFVAKLTLSPDDETILGTIVLMAHSLGLNVVAEGVESQDQIEYLREKDCDEIQGYHFAKPMPGSDCVRFIHEHRARHSAPRA